MMFRHNTIGCKAACLAIGMIIGAGAAMVIDNCCNMRGMKKKASRAVKHISSVIVDNVRDMM